ncbi:plasmid pRiA4b ORF-3 family protein [Planomonospora algeriensis]
MSTAQIHQLKIQLKGSKPPIWRRIQVPGTVTLAGLHPMLLAVMGWYGGHMYAFRVGDEQYGDPDPELGMKDAARLTLAGAVRRAGADLFYDYDFGDGWEHRLTVEKVLPAEKDVAYPRCLAGRRACPPEDCGGIYGFHAFLEALADPGHPEHDWAVERAPLDYDPAGFDLEWANARLADPAAHLLLDLW